MKKRKVVLFLFVILLLTGCQKKYTETIQNESIGDYSIPKEIIDNSDRLDESQEVKTEEESSKQEESVQEESKPGEGTEDSSISSESESSIDVSSEWTEDSQGSLEESTSEPSAPAKIDASMVDKEQLATYDNTSISWGQGVNVDDKNRPTGAIMYEKKYGEAGGVFIGEDKKIVYLTFDEGYEYPKDNSMTGNTAKILDVLKEKKVKAVFFVTLPYVKANPDLVKRMIAEGHVVGNHSVTHPSKGLPSLTIDKEINEVTELHNYMVDNYDYQMYVFRYPAGIFSEQSLHMLSMLHYKALFWSFAHRDWITDDQPDPKKALENAVEKLHPGAIYLLHGVSVTNTQILGDFIEATEAKGYAFELYPKD